jgi:hypothetical protein
VKKETYDILMGIAGFDFAVGVAISDAIVYAFRNIIRHHFLRII